MLCSKTVCVVDIYLPTVQLGKYPLFLPPFRESPESRLQGQSSRLFNERSQHYIFYQINALSNNLETVTSLVKAQSAIIENLSNQVSTAVKGTGYEKEFKQIFDKFANHTKKIQNVTKKLNKTVSHINELAAVWSETTITFNKDFKSLKEKTGQTQDDIEDLERKLTEKIDKLEQEVKTLKFSLNYAQEESASLKEGKNIFILFHRLSCSSKYSRKLFKLIA